MKVKRLLVINYAKCFQRRQYDLFSSAVLAVFLVAGPLIIPGKTFAESGKKVGGPETPLSRQNDVDTGGKNLIDPPSTLTGKKMRISQVMQIAYAAGFQNEDQLVAATAIAISESGLWSAARNWHPEKGYRPATDQITVEGPSIAWSNGRQMHSDRGLWQIASYWYPQYSDTVADNPQMSAVFAYELSQAGANFSYWDSYLGQRAQLHYDKSYDGWPALRPLVKRFILNVQPLPKPLESENSIEQGIDEPTGIN
jgi:hypothetical protein